MIARMSSLSSSVVGPGNWPVGVPAWRSARDPAAVWCSGCAPRDQRDRPVLQRRGVPRRLPGQHSRADVRGLRGAARRRRVSRRLARDRRAVRRPRRLAADRDPGERRPRRGPQHRCARGARPLPDLRRLRRPAPTPVAGAAARQRAPHRLGLVVGSVERFDGRTGWLPDWVEDVHVVRREQVRIEEFLPLLRNLYTWNKLFRRDFWDAQGLWFPGGVAYEDQPIVTQALRPRPSIDVLPEIVYRYRARDDQSRSASRRPA